MNNHVAFALIIFPLFTVFVIGVHIVEVRYQKGRIFSKRTRALIIAAMMAVYYAIMMVSAIILG